MKSFITGLIVLVSIVLVGPAHQQAAAQTSTLGELRSAIDAVIAASDMPNAWWTVNVKEVASENAWYQKDVGRSFIPASNTKLYTTAAALDLLGPDYRYETSLWTDGTVSSGVLEGNLIVKGSGDPVIGGRFNGGDITKQFRDWADSLKVLGIHRINGSIIGDDNAFDDQALGYGWQWDDLDFWYAAETSALSFNDNCVDFALVALAENMPAELRWEPMMTTYIQASNHSISTMAGGGIVEGYARKGDSNSFVLSSKVPVGKTDFESLTVKNPTQYFVHVLREVLLAEGISVIGSPVDIDDLLILPTYQLPEYEAGFLFSTFSPPLSDIVRVLNKNSQNLYAEQLLKTIAKEAPVQGYTKGSAAMGFARSKRFFGKTRIDTLHIQLVDGSGLARQNLVTSDMTMNLLLHMAHHPTLGVSKAFYDSLPIGGVDGTLSGRMKGTAAQNNVRAKTGTVGNASALSGYVTTNSGTKLAFSIMANHFIGSSRGPRAVQDEIVAILASHDQ